MWTSVSPWLLASRDTVHIVLFDEFIDESPDARRRPTGRGSLSSTLSST
jgi:hypothetical protein